MTHSRAVRRALAITAAFAFAATAVAQAPRGPGSRPQVPDTGGRSATYDPLKTFAPFTMPQAASVYRGGDGAPTPAYWQNSADYEMHASIDTATKTLSNIETITYTNNSPGGLNSLWLQVEQNTYRADARPVRCLNGVPARLERMRTALSRSGHLELLRPTSPGSCTSLRV